MRIVSLLPAATETVLALGLGHLLAGRTDECPDLPGVPVVVRAAQPPGLDAAGIDAWVRDHPGELYAVDDAALARIRPDLVLTQDLCRVCAVPRSDAARALARVGDPARVVSLEPTRLADVLAQVATVADAAGHPGRGRTLVAALQDRLDAVAAAVAGRDPVPTLVLEWLDPPFTAGHWVPDAVRAAGGRPVLGADGRASGPTTWDTVRTALAPGTVVVLAPCGTDPHATWTQLDPVPADLLDDRTVTVDLACPSPRLIDAIEALAAHLHPDAGLPGHPELAVTAAPGAMSDPARTLAG